MSVFYVLTSGFLSSLPFIGSVLGGIWMPFGTILLAYGAKNALEGKHPDYDAFFTALKTPGLRTRLIYIGIIYAIGLQISVTVFLAFGAENVNAMLNAAADESATADVSFPFGAMAVSLLVYIPVLLLSLFSPLLIADSDQKVGKSLFDSFMGIVYQWPSVLSAAAIYLGVTISLAAASFALFVLLNISAYYMFFMPLFVVFTTGIAYAMLWPMYRDMYGVMGRFRPQSGR